jgi:hypothetical protein
MRTRSAVWLRREERQYIHELKVQLFSLDVVAIEVIAIRVFGTHVVSFVLAVDGIRVCAQCEEGKTCAARSGGCTRSGRQPGSGADHNEPDIDGL